MFDTVPEEWREAVLSDVAEIVTAGISADELATKPEVHHYSLPAFDLGIGPEIGPGESIKSNKTVVPKDCILFSKLNPRIPRIWRVREIASPHSYCSTEFWPLVRKSDDVDLDFLTYFLGSAAFLGNPAIVPSSSTNSHQRVDRRSFESFVLPLPTLDEQRRIAEVLRSVDEAVASAVAVVREADRSLKLLAEQLLVAEAEATGSEVRLGDLLASIEAGVSVNSEGRLTEEGELGILKTSCVSAARFDPAEHKAVLKSERKRVRVPVTAESIILSRMNTLDLVGANAFVADDHLNLYLPDRLWLLKTNPNVRCRWLAYYMKTARFRGQIVDIASGTSGSMKNISKSRFAELPIYIPSIELQDAAVEVLTSVEQAAFRAAGALESNKRVKASLSGDLLSGRVRVPA